MTAGQIAAHFGHLLAATAILVFIVALYRWVRRQSAAVGLVFATAIILRAVAGAALFWVSYLQLPVAASLQLGGGFWVLALDASGYYQLAAIAVDAGSFYSLDHAVPSPAFVNALAVWMTIVGVSPASGMFMNLALYATAIALIVRCARPANDWRRDLPLLIGVGAYSFAPVILIHSTQPLKDELFNTLVIGAAVSMLALARLVYSPRLRDNFRPLAIGSIAIAAAAFGMAGVRWYFAIILIGTVAVVLGVFTAVSRTTPLGRYTAASTGVLLLMLGGLTLGARPVVEALLPRLGVTHTGAAGAVVDAARSAAGAVTSLFSRPATARVGFLRSGGGTNIVVPVTGEPRAAVADSTAPVSEDVARAIPRSPVEHLRAIGTGLLVLAVPISLVQRLLDINMAGGRGLLVVSDVDTLFTTGTALLMLGLLWTRRRDVADRWPVVLFLLVLAAVTATLLAYTVTNFGTIWRIRTLAVVPVWLLAITLLERTTARRVMSPSTDAATTAS